MIQRTSALLVFLAFSSPRCSALSLPPVNQNQLGSMHPTHPSKESNVASSPEQYVTIRSTGEATPWNPASRQSHSANVQARSAVESLGEATEVQQMQSGFDGVIKISESPLQAWTSLESWANAYPRCLSGLAACAPFQQHQKWLNGNGTAWKVGFALCCATHHSSHLCEPLSGDIFKPVAGGAPVKDAESSILAHLCQEVDLLIQADGIQQLQARYSTDSSGGSSSLEVEHSATAHRARLVASCREQQQCWEDVTGLQDVFELLQVQGDDYKDCQDYGVDDDRCDDPCKFLWPNGVPSGSFHKLSMYHPECCDVPADEDLPQSKTNAKPDKTRYCDSQCFPRTAKVVLGDGMTISVHELQQGTKLLSPTLTDDSEALERTDYLVDAHIGDPLRPTRIAVFVECSHEFMNQDEPLLATPNHLIFAKGAGQEHIQWRLVQAGDLKAGDFIQALVDGKVKTSRITFVRLVEALGTYAPLTASGRLFVQGVAVSSYSISTGNGPQQQLWRDNEHFKANVESWYKIFTYPITIGHYLGLDCAAIVALGSPDSGNRFYLQIADSLVQAIYHVGRFVGAV